MRAVALALGVAGFALVASSLLPGEQGMDDAWRRDFLMTVGASLALFAPFYLITRSLDRHLDRVAAETVQQVEEVRTDTVQRVEQVRGEASEASAALAGQVEALRVDVDRRLDEIGTRVRDRLAAEVALTRGAFEAIGDRPTRAGLIDALTRAQRLGIVEDGRPPRVSMADYATSFVSAELSEVGELYLRTESLNGSVLDWIAWSEDVDVEDVLVEVGSSLRKYETEPFGPEWFFRGLADLLHAAHGDAELRPAVQLCGAQWMVCTWGLRGFDARHSYGVPLGVLQTDPASVNSRMAEEAWVDRSAWEEARDAALALFPARPDPWAMPAF